MGENSMDNLLHWLWLTTLNGLSEYDITALLEQFDNISDIYMCKEFDNIVGIKPNIKERLRSKDLKTAKEIYETCEKKSIKILTFDMSEYPDSLRLIENPPYVIYLKGEILNWDRLLTIGVVGTRHCTDYGISATKKICTGLAEKGVTIVSGMARGIDSAAAISALSVGNKTVAVLGCGVDVVYPPENTNLMQKIIENGAVISEYPPGTQPNGRNFPRRNRIISGLSRGILVTEAPKKSGALITANYALNQGKDIFAVPGSIFKETCMGSNELLTSSAKAVSSAEDILCEYVYEISRIAPIKSKKRTIFKDSKKEKVNNEIKISIDDKKYSSLSEEEKSIVLLLIGGNVNIDDIKRQSGIDISKLTTTLSMLEFGGYIKKLPGNNYKLNI